MPNEITERQRQYREEYLRSPHWLQTRSGALERAANRCQVCNADKQLDVHHRTYERIGRERPDDLTVLCRRCHDLFHGSSKLHKPKASKPTPSSEPKSKKQRKYPSSGKLTAVLSQLEPGRGYTSGQLAALSALSPNAAGQAAVRLAKANKLVRRDKRWWLPPLAGSGVQTLRHRDALASTCPTCGAAPGRACPMGGVHMARYRGGPNTLAA